MCVFCSFIQHWCGTFTCLCRSRHSIVVVVVIGNASWCNVNCIQLALASVEHCLNMLDTFSYQYWIDYKLARNRVIVSKQQTNLSCWFSCLNSTVSIRSFYLFFLSNKFATLLKQTINQSIKILISFSWHCLFRMHFGFECKILLSINLCSVFTTKFYLHISQNDITRNSKLTKAQSQSFVWP